MNKDLFETKKNNLFEEETKELFENNKKLFGEKDVVITKNAEEESLEEISETLKSFKENANRENKMFLQNTDSEFWFCMCFQTRDQVEEFLEKTGWGKKESKYIDGLDVSKKIGIELENKTPPYPKFKIDKKYKELV